MLIHILFVSLCVAASLCCKCIYSPPKEAYCNAEWVSLTKVVASNIKDNENPFEQREYKVKHSKIFKKPPGCKHLPKRIYTSMQSASCGVKLDVGKEYLLAGSYIDNKLRISSCGQIAANENFFGIIMERKNMTKKFFKKIKSYKC